jgi:uncharacterized membrane protein YgdD (TMEM256/DUF423 family)
MHQSAKVIGIIFAATAVIIGAFGAHALKSILSNEQLLSFETGVRYQFYHAFALLLLSMQASNKLTITVRKLFALGIICFSGSIYLLNLLKAQGQIGIKGLGIITPIGGLLLVCAWCVWLYHTIQSKANKHQ